MLAGTRATTAGLIGLGLFVAMVQAQYGEEWAGVSKLKLDLAECRARAQAALFRYEDKEQARALLMMEPNTRMYPAPWDIAWATDRIASYPLTHPERPLSIVAPFLDGINDPSPVIRWRATRVLGVLKDPRAVDALTDHLINEPDDDNCQFECIRALRAIGKPGIPGLVKALETLGKPKRTHNLALVGEIAQALASMGAVEALPAMANKIKDPRLFHTGDGSCVVAAIVSLGAPAIEFNLRRLGETAADYTSTTNRVGVRTASQARDLVLDSGFPHYACADVPSAYLAKKATVQAGRGYPYISELLASDDLNVRLGAAICLAWLGDARAEPLLLQRLAETGKDLPRLDVMEALGALRSAASVPRLRVLLEDPDPRWVAIAAVALGRIGSPDAVEDLIKLTEKSVGGGEVTAVELSAATFYALGRIGAVRAAPLLIKLSVPDDRRGFWVAAPAIRALATIPGQAALDAITARLSDADAVAIAAIEALGERRDPASVAPLCKSLGQKDRYVCLAALRALAAIADKRAVPAIIPFLKSDDNEMVAAAMAALGKIGEPSALPPLRDALAAAKAKQSYVPYGDLARDTIAALEAKERQK
jgi:HEAT repeat protein